MSGISIQVGGQNKQVADLTPPGTISMFGGALAPDGWLLCDGSLKSRTTFAALFQVIGAAFGAGDGTTTFNVPDLIDLCKINAMLHLLKGLFYQ